MCSSPALSGCDSTAGGRGEISYLKASQIQLGSSESMQVVPIELNMWTYIFWQESDFQRAILDLNIVKSMQPGA